MFTTHRYRAAGYLLDLHLKGDTRRFLAPLSLSSFHSSIACSRNSLFGILPHELPGKGQNKVSIPRLARSTNPSETTGVSANAAIRRRDDMGLLPHHKLCPTSEGERARERLTHSDQLHS